ncbi:hypothetical protein Hamer_G015564, partial [Homarus americanus]
GKALSEEVNIAMEYANEKYLSVIPTIMKFRAKSPRFQAFKFTGAVTKTVSAIEWWNSQASVLGSNIPSSVQQLPSAVTSSSGVEQKKQQNFVKTPEILQEQPRPQTVVCFITGAAVTTCIHMRELIQYLSYSESACGGIAQLDNYERHMMQQDATSRSTRYPTDNAPVSTRTHFVTLNTRRVPLQPHISKGYRMKGYGQISNKTGDRKEALEKHLAATNIHWWRLDFVQTFFLLPNKFTI